MSADRIFDRLRSSALGRGGGAAEHGQCVTVGQVVERVERGRVVLAQRPAQRVGVPVAGPDQILVPPRQHLDRLGVGAVPGDRAMVVPVGAHQIGQQFGVCGIGFRSGDMVAVAVTSDRQRVDRVHLVTGRDQRVHPQTAIGFNADHDLAGVGGVGGHDVVEPADSG